MPPSLEPGGQLLQPAFLLHTTSSASVFYSPTPNLFLINTRIIPLCVYLCAHVCACVLTHMHRKRLSTQSEDICELEMVSMVIITFRSLGAFGEILSSWTPLALIRPRERRSLRERPILGHVYTDQLLCSRKDLRRDVHVLVYSDVLLRARPCSCLDPMGLLRGWVSPAGTLVSGYFPYVPSRSHPFLLKR